MTNKKLNIVLAGVLCSAGVMAQENIPVIDQKKDVVELGRNVSYDEAEITGAVSTVRSEALSHKNSIKPSNQLFGMAPGLMVLQNAGTVWENGATMYIRGLGTTNGKTPMVLVDGIE